MNVTEYLDHAGLQPEDFAKMIGVAGTTVRRWMEGQAIKSDDMKRLIKVTHGKITAESLLEQTKQAD